jgi:hypothetical protein
MITLEKRIRIKKKIEKAKKEIECINFSHQDANISIEFWSIYQEFQKSILEDFPVRPSSKENEEIYDLCDVYTFNIEVKSNPEDTKTKLLNYINQILDIIDTKLS